MANIDMTLSPILSRREPISRVVQHNILGTEQLIIRAGWNLEVPSYWDLQVLRITIVTDATVANRQVRLTQYFNGLAIPEWTTNSITASLTKVLYFGASQYQTDVWPNGSANKLNIYPDSFLFGGDDYIKIHTDTGKAGDTLDINAVFRWRNFALGLDKPELFEGKEYPG